MISVKQFITSRSALASLSTQLSRQKALTEAVKKILPEPINREILGAVMQARSLTLFVDSPVWASRLRYLAPQLMKQLKQQGLLIDRIKPRILLQEKRTGSRSGRRAVKLSRGSAETVRQTATAIEDKPLREALLRLSRHSDMSK